MKYVIIIMVSLILLPALSGCGVRGPLTHPTETVESQ